MSDEIQDSKAKTKTRTVRLSDDIDAKLLALSERLGVTVHSYLTNEIGKAVNRDYLGFQLAERQGQAIESFMANILTAIAEESKGDKDA